jgi:hypothetical protein
MFMSNQYPVDLPERQVDNLFAEVGTAVDQQAGFTCFH